MPKHLDVTRTLLPPLVAFLGLASGAAAHATCATSVAQLREVLQEPAFPLSWEETGMGDARPLLVTLDDRAGALFISFVKTGAGLLAEGPARVCRVDDRVEARFLREGLQLGGAASLVLTVALRGGAAVGLQRTGPGRLRIGTIGWRGDFIPGSSGAGLRANFGSF